MGIRQDVEGQPFMDEYRVKEENGELVYHMQQNTIGDRRVYLVPKHKLEIGESFKYEVRIISKEGHYGSPVLLVGEEYSRIHLSAAGFNNGIQNYDELGTSHITISFSGNNFTVVRESPSGGFFDSSVPVQNPNGNYELYIGAFSGHNGKVHMDFDNFELCSEEIIPPGPNLEERVAELELKVAELENKTSLLESLINKIINFIESLPKGLRKTWN